MRTIELFIWGESRNPRAVNKGLAAEIMNGWIRISQRIECGVGGEEESRLTARPSTVNSDLNSY